MNMDQKKLSELIEARFGKHVALLLDSQTQQLSGDVQERLKEARDLAISRAKPEFSPAFAQQLQTANQSFSGSRFNNPLWSLTSWLIPIAVVVFGLVAISEWQEEQRIKDIANVDIALLTDDVPPDAFVDNGFMAYLKLKTSTKPQVEQTKPEDEKI